MGETEGESAALVAVGLSLVVVGMLTLESAAWPLKYGVMGLGLCLSVLAVYRADAVSPAN